MKTEKRLFITYLFPGTFFPESSEKLVKSTDIPTTVPADCYGFYFSETEYAVDGQKEFIGKTKRLGKTIMIGESIHVDNIPAMDRGQDTNILKCNIENNSPTKRGIKTHLGNWQMEDKDTIAMPASSFEFGKPMIYENWKK